MERLLAKIGVSDSELAFVGDRQVMGGRERVRDERKLPNNEKTSGETKKGWCHDNTSLFVYTWVENCSLLPIQVEWNRQFAKPPCFLASRVMSPSLRQRITRSQFVRESPGYSVVHCSHDDSQPWMIGPMQLRTPTPTLDH